MRVARAGVQAIRRPATALSGELVQSDQAAEIGGLWPSRVLQRIPGGEIRRLGNVVSRPLTGSCETKKCAVDLHPVVGAAGTLAVRASLLGFLPARAVRNVWRIFENVAAPHDWPFAERVVIQREPASTDPGYQAAVRYQRDGPSSSVSTSPRRHEGGAGSTASLCCFLRPAYNGRSGEE
jgi:hypothetical protein